MTLFNHARSIRATVPVLLLVLAAIPATPQGKGKEGGKDDPDRVVAGGTLPAGWAARPDRPGDSKVALDGGTFHFVMGPAATFYNNSWTKSGNYKFSARLTQTKTPDHSISYGIMIGGTDLAGPDQKYTYFLVRNRGEYFISNREGARTATQVNWTAHPAIQKESADGKQVNTLGIEVQGDNVIFSVNGQEVTRRPKAGLHVDGLYGFRIGHNLDVDVDQISR